MWDDTLTEMSNNGFVLAGGAMTYMCYVWHRRYGKNWIYWMFLLGMLLTSIAIMVRIGGWSPAIKFAPPGMDYHPTYMEWRWLPSLVSSLAYIAGTVVIIGFIESAKKRDMLAWAVMIVAASVGIGLL